MTRFSAPTGDWYDVIILDGDRVAIVAGDVVGNGPAAAAVMGQLRSALAGFLLEGHSPSQALQWLSRLAGRIDGALASTAICLVLHTGTGELYWARAGHPPPLLLDPAAGEARYLEDAHGVVLGFPDTLPNLMPYTEGHTVVAAEASVLLYTDGLVERRGEVIDDGLDRLAAAAATHLHAPPEDLIPALLDAGLAGAGPPDDVGLIVARLLPGPLHHRGPAVPAQLPALRRTVTAWATASALPDSVVEDLQLALGEAVANTIEHAYPNGLVGEFDCLLNRDRNGAVHVEVRDQGIWRPPPVDPGYRGRGLAMINALGVDVTLNTTGPGTCLRFTLPTAPTTPTTPTTPTQSAEAIRAGAVPAGVETSVGLRSEHHPDGVLVLRLGGDIDLTTIDAAVPPCSTASAAPPARLSWTPVTSPTSPAPEWDC